MPHAANSCVLDLTARMEQAARRADWDEVQRLLDERSALLVAPFAQPAETVAAIVRTDGVVAALAVEQRERLRHELDRLSQGRKAVDAYRDSAG